MDEVHEINGMHIFHIDIYTFLINFNVTFQECLGKSKCSIIVSSHTFGDDPCPGIPKALLVDAQCT